MERSTRCGKLPLYLIAVLLALSAPGSAFAQKLRAEGLLGFNLFSLSHPELMATLEAANSETALLTSDLTIDGIFIFGANLGYSLGNLELGAEFLIMSGGGTNSDLKVDGDTVADTSSSYDYDLFRIGPTLRYYFQSANPLLLPFAGAALSYAKATVGLSKDAGNVKFDQGYLDIGVFGGLTYALEGNLYIGGTARVDFLSTIGDDTLTGVDFFGTDVDIKEITTDGWMPLSICITLGSRF